MEKRMWTPNPDNRAAFWRDGYLFARQLFATDEIEALKRHGQDDPAIASIAMHRADGSGKGARLAIWNELPPAPYGGLPNHPSLALSASILLGEEVYHWHSKLMLKDAYSGGAWEWHQDYGYWYKQCLRPDLISCAVAVDRATRANGCMQLLAGSHRYGRIDHGPVGDQTGADPARVTLIQQRCPIVHAEMEPGDVLFFHSNTLHRSAANESPDSRWILISCFNTRSNSPPPPLQTEHPPYTPLPVLHGRTR